VIRVSVIVPAYNAQPFIEPAVASALRQTEQRIEVIVIDDASTDATADIVSGMRAQDARVRLLQNPTNLGPGAARNRGLAAARGSWIALLDADDLFEPQRLARLLAIGEANGADIVSDNLLIWAEADASPPSLLIPPARLAAPRRMPPEEFIIGDIGKRRRRRRRQLHTSYGFMQPMFRRRFLDVNDIRYHEASRFGEDYILALRCLLCGARWWITPEAMYRYRVRPGTLTEVQTAADLDRIRQAEGRMLRYSPLVAGNASLVRALHRHKAAIDRRFYYRAFTDAMKAGSFAASWRLLFDEPGSWRHILLESLRQAPVVAAKAARGGYSCNNLAWRARAATGALCPAPEDVASGRGGIAVAIHPGAIQPEGDHGDGP
jgi:glycosyltransferase involved in cell wall biosynthesis